MNNLTAASLARVAWNDNGRRATFAAARPGYGVVDQYGRWLTFGNSTSPWCVRRKADAIEVAATLLPGHDRWIKEVA